MLAPSEALMKLLERHHWHSVLWIIIIIIILIIIIIIITIIKIIIIIIIIIVITNQLLILNGVNTNLISRSLHNVLTNLFILRCVMMEKRTDAR